jgi:hypothetical protein
MKIRLDVISSDKRINDFMHAADVFEQGKQLGKYECMEVTGTAEINIFNLINVLKNALENCDKNVVFIGIRSIDDLIFNFPAPYIMKDVQSISDGSKWGLFRDQLIRLGYEVETDQFMRVTSATRMYKKPEEKKKYTYDLETSINQYSSYVEEDSNSNSGSYSGWD